MSIFDNNITPSVNKSEKEWRDILFHEYFMVNYEDRMKNTWGSFMLGPYSFEDFLKDGFISSKYRSVAGFKRYIKSHRAMDLHMIGRWKDVFQRVWERYGVMFSYKIQYIKGSKFMNGIKFIKVLG